MNQKNKKVVICCRAATEEQAGQKLIEAITGALATYEHDIRKERALRAITKKKSLLGLRAQSTITHKTTI